jgi:hypothetical protein
MAADHVRIPVRMVNGVKWGNLSAISDTHEVVGEKVTKVEENFTFSGQHRVRLYRFRKNVHWRIPAGVAMFDISAVSVSDPPRRPQRQR